MSETPNFSQSGGEQGPPDAAGCPVGPGAKVHLHGEVTAVDGQQVTVRLDAPEGETGEEITVRSCCVHCDEHSH